MDARPIAPAGFDVLADGEPQVGVAEAVIGRKGEPLDRTQQRVAAEHELAQAILVAGLRLPGAVEGGLVAVGLHAPDATAFEMDAQPLVEPAVDVEPEAHGGVAEAAPKDDGPLDG